MILKQTVARERVRPQTPSHCQIFVANPVSDPDDAKFARCFKRVWQDHPNRRDWPMAQMRSLNGFRL